MRRVRVAWGAAAVAVLVGVGLLGAWRVGLFDPAPSVNNPSVENLPADAIRVMANHRDIPWGIAFLPDSSALITERGSGQLFTVTNDAKVTDVQKIDGVNPDGEGGLLGVAVGPQYATDGWVYAYYTT